MECRDLDLTIVSAEDLKQKKGFFSRSMHTFAVAYADPSYRRRTSTDSVGGRNPNWNEKISFTLPDYFFHQPNTSLTIEIFNQGTFSNSLLGVVRIPLRDALQQQSSSSAGAAPEVLTYQVLRKSGKKKGTIRLLIRVGEKVTVAAPAPPPPPPPQMGYAQPYYGAPPPVYGGGYGYGQPGYGYGQPGYAQTRPSGMGGMGFGTGLLAGAVGGLLVGEMIDDVGDYGGGDYGGGDFGGGDFGGF